MQENRQRSPQKESAHDQPYDPMDTALDSAARLLHQQGYVLEVTVRGENAVQAGCDGSGHPCEDNSIILKNAMTAAGFSPPPTTGMY